jgi:hypothetical protein
VTLTGQSTTNGVTFNWTGPNNYVQQNMPSPVVNVPGDYTLTVINPVNGCVKVLTLTLPADTAPPADVTGTSSGKLTCLVTSVTLTGLSSTQDVDYEWDSPNGNYLTSSPVVPVVTAGNYTLIVTNYDNGCSVVETVPVISDKTIPTAILDVANNSTVLQQTTNTISATNVPLYAYNWSITNWTALSGQSTPTFTYKSGNTGTTSKITLNLKDNNNGCTNSYNVNLSAVAFKSALAEDNQSTVQPASDVTLSTYPVPAIGKVFVEFASPEQTDINVTVYNTNGLVVANLFNNRAEANLPYKLVFNGSETLPAGIYICVLRTKTKTITNKILIK